ncbi:tautomerase family protein [uncultured Roseovarius sp.]|uniref:tautomerase family protein n=1 Tax=uncultured Roseovarius sp. TaxID=293344 RepID=UPI0025DFA124|nr:tautomerase family protein [uncultured Roseovarius sp.]
MRPLVRIDVIKGRGRKELRLIADVLHNCAVEAFSLSVRDRFQIITEHEPHLMIIQDVGLGFDRSNDVVVQITSTPRSLAARKKFYALAAERL